jgi:hypothetical protein
MKVASQARRKARMYQTARMGITTRGIRVRSNHHCTLLLLLLLLLLLVCCTLPSRTAEAGAMSSATLLFASPALLPALLTAFATFPALCASKSW